MFFGGIYKKGIWLYVWNFVICIYGGIRYDVKEDKKSIGIVFKMCFNFKIIINNV